MHWNNLFQIIKQYSSFNYLWKSEWIILDVVGNEICYFNSSIESILLEYNYQNKTYTDKNFNRIGGKGCSLKRTDLDSSRLSLDFYKKRDTSRMFFFSKHMETKKFKQI